jgi:GntR family transcriptional regulator, transcriptional repressor for pyruvate dehydrogenase complex
LRHRAGRRLSAAPKRTARDRYDLQSTLVEDILVARQSRQLSDSIATLRLRLVELSGNATLTVIAKMLHEITKRHNASPP